MKKPENKDLIILNEEAIIADGYDVVEYQRIVDEIFAERGCYKDEEGMYCGEWAKVGGAANALADDQEWFKLRHIKKWVGYSLDKSTGKYYYSGDMIKSILKYEPERQAELL
ncbi:MAG: hypothetical protein LBG67_01525 [Campylobacteraceae bacterium]|jgi:hypothetical protein|nr:hypothetical protein [Campylobacteraceae bacterium]